MRLIKMFGLAAMAAIAAMAFVGVTSASAVTELEEVVVCKEDVSPCPTGKAFPSGTVLDGELETGTNAVLLSDLGNVECSTSTTTGKTTSTLASGEITGLTFGSCKLGKTACTVTVENAPYSAQVLLNTEHNGYHMVVTPIGGLRPQARVTCGTLLDCTFGSSSVLLTVELKTSDVVLSVSQELERGLPGLTCPALTSKWDAKYLVRCLEGSPAVLVGCWPEME